MPFDTLSFAYLWRPYQQRVLSAIDQHLDDQRLHIVEAPDVGKITLGLEVFHRIGKKALVLSPTRVIRDQWLSRLKDFLPKDDNNTQDWASNGLGNKPSFFLMVGWCLSGCFWLKTKYCEGGR